MVKTCNSMLDGKKILLISAKFFGYESDIYNELISRNAEVDMVPDRPFNSAAMKALTKIFPSLMQMFIYFYYNIKYSHMFEKKYDVIFVVEGITLSKLVLKRLKINNSTSDFILYVWDSVKNRPHLYDSKNFYDRIFTFDPEDADILNLNFRPLFYTNTFERTSDLDLINDINFVGTAHSDRYDIIKKILESSCTIFLKKFIYLYIDAKWYYYWKKIVSPSYRSSISSEFKFTTMNKKEVSNIIKTSKATIDIEHVNQDGLTMRTFEVLGARRKLITTNQSIKNYDFYNPRNILIIDRLKPEIPNEFFRSDYEDLDPAMYYKYSIKGWIDEIFSI